MRKSPEEVLSRFVNGSDPAKAVAALERAGYVLLTKSEHLTLKRAQTKLAKVTTKPTGM